MKTALRLLTLALAAITMQAQKSLDLKPCMDFMKQFEAQINKFNADHKEYEVSLMCADNRPRTKVPEQRIALTPSEIQHLHEIRRMTDAAYGVSTDYENYLIRAHHVKKPEIGDPCWYFVGIVLDTDYITVDKNMGFGGSDCK